MALVKRVLKGCPSGVHPWEAATPAPLPASNGAQDAACSRLPENRNQGTSTRHESAPAPSMTLLGSINPAYSVAGLAVGLLVGMTGVGGGSLMTPLLILVFGIHPATAVGTDLLFAAVTKSVGTAAHGLGQTVDWRVTGRLAAGSIPATAATILILSRVGSPTPATEHLMSLVLGIALVLTAAATLFRARIAAYAAHRSGALTPGQVAVLTVLTGVVLGVVVSLSSVGAGALGMTALILLYRSVPIARLVGSDIAHAVPLTLIAGLGHWYLGGVNVPLLAALLLGSLPGIVVGSVLAARVPDFVLRPMLAGTLLFVGSRLIA